MASENDASLNDFPRVEEETHLVGEEDNNKERLPRGREHTFPQANLEVGSSLQGEEGPQPIPLDDNLIIT